MVLSPGTAPANPNYAPHKLEERAEIMHKGKPVYVNFPPYGPATFNQNCAQIKGYDKAATTAESVSICSFMFDNIGLESLGASASCNNAKQAIFDVRWLQAGMARLTREGIYFNIPVDKSGYSIYGPKEMDDFLREKEFVNGVCILDNVSPDCTFVKHNSFRNSAQGIEEFTQEGLARALEGTSLPRAEEFHKFLDPRKGWSAVHVWGNKPKLYPYNSLVCFTSMPARKGNWFSIGFWDGGNNGYAFRVSQERPFRRAKKTYE